jgi:hypothetical protein
MDSYSSGWEPVEGGSCEHYNEHRAPQKAACFMSLKFSFGYFPFFFTESSTSFTSYIVQIILTCLALVLQTLQFIRLSLI